MDVSGLMCCECGCSMNVGVCIHLCVYCCVCNMSDGNIPYKSSGLTLHVCTCMCMDVVRCMHAYMST